MINQTVEGCLGESSYSDRSYLHITEYPDDDYNHIFGNHDKNHKLSKLQMISKLRIQDTIRNKKPIDTVSDMLHHI